MKKGVIIGLLLVVILAGGLAIWAVGVSNDEKQLVNRMEAQKEVVNLYFDKMWKILKQKAGVAESSKDAFKDIYVGIMEGRYSGDTGPVPGETTGGMLGLPTGGAALMKWVQEQNPEFDQSVFTDLQNSIETERNGFFVEQTKLTDMLRQQKDMHDLFPRSMIVGKRPLFEYIPITSSVTEEVVTTGKEDDIDLF
jgi:hypothetical protein